MANQSRTRPAWSLKLPKHRQGTEAEKFDGLPICSSPGVDAGPGRQLLPAATNLHRLGDIPEAPVAETSQPGKASLGSGGN